jgi:PAS domain S-box-containing protein
MIFCGGREMGEEDKLHRDPQLRLVEQTNDFPATQSLRENDFWEPRRSLERERRLLQSMIDGARNYHLVYLDRDFNFVYVNEAYAKTCGYRANELVGKNHFDLYPHEENKAIFVGVRDSGIAVEFHDKPFIFPDQPERGITYWDWTLSPVKDASGNVEGLVFSLFESTERKRAEEALRRSREELELRVQERTAELNLRIEQLARLSTELTLTEQRERRRLAVLIHDHLQQLLVGAKIGLEVMTNRLDGDHQKKGKEICKLVVECLKTARSLNAQLSPTILYERGLGSALKWLAETMQETYKLDIETQIDPHTEVEREETKVLLFESVRELLFNVVKHAGAASARVEMSRDDGDGLRISVIDHGVGFDPKAMLKNLDENHFGLFSIRERMELIGGKLEIQSSPGHGAALNLIAPTDRVITSKEAPEEAHDVSLTQTAAASAKTGKRIRVLLVDDHIVMRQGLSSLLSEHPDIEIAGEAANGEESVQLARTLQPDVILMDISMPMMNGIDATRLIHSEFPHIRTIGLSMYDDAETEMFMRDAGAVGFVNKGAHSDDLVDAIRQSIHHV